MKIITFASKCDRKRGEAWFILSTLNCDGHQNHTLFAKDDAMPYMSKNLPFTTLFVNADGWPFILRLTPPYVINITFLNSLCQFLFIL